MDLQSLTVTGKGYSKIYSENPFYEEPPPKAFYYPSKERQLSNSERKTALSPERAGDRSCRKQPQAPEQKFLSGSHNIKPLSSIHQHGSKSPPSAKFDESWPESEQPSSPSILTADESKLDASPTARFQTLPVHPSTSDLINSALSAGRQAHQLSKQTEKPTEKAALAAKAGRERTSVADTSAEKGSVLQRYIERFRHGAPMSREERLQEEGNKKKEFWWLGSDPPTPQSTSTPKQEEGRSVSLTSQECGGGLTVENLRKRDRFDEATEQLQQKAERLLSSAHSIGSSEPIVSTVGLGSTGSDVSSFSEPAVRPAFIPHQYSGRDAGRWTNRQPPSAKDSEGDILYKWRLQRKLEQAREGVPAPVSVKSAPKTQAEQEMSSRLAAFREKLLQRPIAAATEVRHAQVERVIRETQRQMDAGVQTSPPATPAWSFTRRVDTSSQSDSPDILATLGLQDQDTIHVSQQSARVASVQSNTAQKEKQKSAMSLKGKSVSYEKLDAGKSENDAVVSKSSELISYEGESMSVDSKLTDSQTSPEKPDFQASHHLEESKYRQFLPAEKPHVDDRGDTLVKKPRSRQDPGREGSDHASRQRGRDSCGRDDEDSPSVSSASERSVTLRESRGQTHGFIHQPGAGGDASDAVVNPLVHAATITANSTSGRMHKGGRAKVLTDKSPRDKSTKYTHHSREGEADSDSSSKLSSRSSKEQRKRGPETGSRSQRSDHVDVHDGETVHPETREASIAKSDRSRMDRAPSNISPAPRIIVRDGGEGGHRHEDPSEKRTRGQGSRGEKSGRSGVVPPPQYSSSPARGSLASAIGQVVHDHLFEASGSMVSSVDSCSSPLFPGHPSPQPRGEVSEVQAASLESVYESDGEFESDPLLQLLRQQRHNHEMKLRQLDSILAERDKQDGDG